MKKVLAMLLAVLMIFSLTGCKKNDYENAVSLMNGGDYQGAFELLKTLAGYEDADSLLNECKDKIITGAVESFDFDTAAQMLADGDPQFAAGYLDDVLDGAVNYLKNEYDVRSASAPKISAAVDAIVAAGGEGEGLVEALNLALESTDELAKWEPLDALLRDNITDINNFTVALNNAKSLKAAGEAAESAKKLVEKLKTSYDTGDEMTGEFIKLIETKADSVLEMRDAEGDAALNAAKDKYVKAVADYKEIVGSYNKYSDILESIERAIGKELYEYSTKLELVS